MIVTVTLNAAVDKAYEMEGSVTPGTVMRVKNCRNTAGGKGLNVARVVRLCREQVMASGLVGGYTGALLEELAKRDGLDARFVHINAETRCCINILDEDHGSTEFLEPGETVTSKEIEDFLEKFDEICAGADVVTISGSAPKGVPKDIYKTLIQRLKVMGRKVILDTSGELLKEGIEGLPDMIKPNQEELGMLIGRPVESVEDAKLAALELHEKGIGRVVISLGKEGALMIDREGIYLGKPPRIQTVNTVGCGDSMVAAFAVAYSRGYDAAVSLKYAVGVSAANARSPYTGHFEQEELEKIYSQVRVEKL